MKEANLIEIEIRPMEKGDVANVTLIESRIFPDPWPLAAFEEELDLPHRGVIVAEAQGVIVGYAAYIMAAGEAHLTNMGVAPEYRGKSIAKRLLNSILEIAKNAECDYIFLDVRPSNVAAIDLYEKFGFVELYRRPGYYRIPPEDAIVMVKTLGDE